MKRFSRFISLFFGIVAAFCVATSVSAIDLSSTHFIIRDPVVGTGGGHGSSLSFGLFSSGNPNLNGLGSSLNFFGHYGFLYYPFVTDVTLTVTPSGSDADLSWPAATSTVGLGWTVGGYKTGIASVSGGPYTYTDVGNVTSYTYENLEPGDYCFILQTYDALGYTIATSNEECITITAALTFAISDGQVSFGPLSFVGPRYATTSGGSSTTTVAHTMTASGNGVSGYTITYVGPTLSSGFHTIPGATITADVDGSPGTEQFALSLSTNGGATITSAYDQTSNNWKFVASTITAIASTSAPSDAETYSFRYLTNESSTTNSGQYATGITYILTGNF
jgi:hypothetical protein